MKPGALAATILLALVALAHLLRLVFGLEVTIEGHAVPLWLSGVACVVAGGVAIMLGRERPR